MTSELHLKNWLLMKGKSIRLIDNVFSLFPARSTPTVLNPFLYFNGIF
jgi:hypothetical protein